jgi:UDP-glucose 4-epimerase
MKILLTGSSSFTGAWFASELAAAGHDVTAIHTRGEAEYSGLAAERVGWLAGRVRRVFGVSFGDPAFLELAAGEPWDVLCHHGAQVVGYQRPDFDVAAALAANTRELPAVLAGVAAGGCCGVLLTAVFEPNEGQGDAELRAFNPYGLSKAFTAQTFAHHCSAAGLALGKFVIPNPFGPYEHQRFTHHLASCWAAGETARVATPAYVRDNIHVGLLSRAYARFAERLAADRRDARMGPSGYRESQGAFARRLADELRARTGWACRLELTDQLEFTEPRVRVNTHLSDDVALGFDESRAWDELAEWYTGRLGAAPSLAA